MRAGHVRTILAWDPPGWRRVAARGGRPAARARLGPPSLLNGADAAGLQPLLALGHLELDPLSLGELAISLHLDLGLMDEEIFAAALRGDDAEPLRSVEPLDRAGCHLTVTPVTPRI